MDRTTWTHSLADTHAFRLEQEKLGGVWTLLGLSADLKSDNDWFRATLGGRSVFVQRFGSEILGFENVCPHRSYPLRTAENGNGPIICGFHHWHYDRRGHVVGVPIGMEVFRTKPCDMQARLRPIEIALCGSLVFGRFSAGKPTETLQQFLGDGWAILAAISTLPPTVHRFGRRVEANWRLMMSITMDDYHIVAVHNRPSYHMNADLQYWRFGLHSALVTGSKDTLQSIADDCEANRCLSISYQILNIFPNLAISLFQARPYWYANIQQFVPVSAERSKWRGWFFPTTFPAANESALERRFRRFSEPIRARIVRHYLEKIAAEDHAACERLQEVAHQAAQPPILGSQEVRVGWFQEAYEQTIGSEEDKA